MGLGAAGAGCSLSYSSAIVGAAFVCADELLLTSPDTVQQEQKSPEASVFGGDTPVHWCYLTDESRSLELLSRNAP